MLHDLNQYSKDSDMYDKKHEIFQLVQHDFYEVIIKYKNKQDDFEKSHFQLSHLDEFLKVEE